MVKYFEYVKSNRRESVNLLKEIEIISKRNLRLKFKISLIDGDECYLLNSIRLLIPLINRVRGPYRKLWTEFFPLPHGHKKVEKTRIHNLR
jgi:hypothetical protein